MGGDVIAGRREREAGGPGLAGEVGGCVQKSAPDLPAPGLRRHEEIIQDENAPCESGREARVKLRESERASVLVNRNEDDRLTLVNSVAQEITGKIEVGRLFVELPVGVKQRRDQVRIVLIGLPDLNLVWQHVRRIVVELPFPGCRNGGSYAAF